MQLEDRDDEALPTKNGVHKDFPGRDSFVDSKAVKKTSPAAKQQVPASLK